MNEKVRSLNWSSDIIDQQTPQETLVNEKSYSIREIASDLGETVHIVRNWIRDLRPYIVLYKTESGSNQFGKEAFETLHLVQRLHRNDGLSMKEIEFYLATNGSRKLSILKPPSSSHHSTAEPPTNFDYQGLLISPKIEVIEMLYRLLNELQDVKHELRHLQDAVHHRSDFDNDKDVNMELILDELPPPSSLDAQADSDIYLPRNKRSRSYKKQENTYLRRFFRLLSRYIRL